MIRAHSSSARAKIGRVDDPIASRYAPEGDKPEKKKDKASDTRAAWGHIGRLVRPHRLRLVGVVVLSAVSMLFQLAMPALAGLATNVIFAGVLGSLMGDGRTREEALAELSRQGRDTYQTLVEVSGAVPGVGIDFERLAWLLAAMVAALALGSLAGFAEAMILRRIVAQISFDLRGRVQEKIDKMPVSYLDSQARGDVLSKMTNDVDNVGSVISETSSQAITACIQLVGLLAIVFTMSWRLTLAVLAVLPIGLAIAGVLVWRAKPHFAAQWKLTGLVCALVEDTFTGHEVLTTSSQTASYAQAFDATNDALYTSSYKAQFITGMVRPIMSFFSWLTFVVVAVLGALQVLAGAMTLGAVQAFVQYAQQLSSPVQSLASLVSLLQSGAASAERVFAFLGEEEEPAEPGSGRVEETGGSIRLEHVSFGYSADREVLHDVSIDVPAGHTVALVGATGSGKTTIVNLIMRFYPVSSGAVLIDGTDIASMPRDDVRRRCGMVLQDTWLYGASIADNIALGREGASRDEIEAAARAVGVDRWASSLPEGLDTKVDDDGVISAGEKQLITIARAFLADRPILILDEATSQVDTATEHRIQHAMSRLRSGRTCLVIAHRLSTIRDADAIVVLEEGRVIERGRHDELLAAGGAYARLYRDQFAAGRELGESRPVHVDTDESQGFPSL